MAVCRKSPRTHLGTPIFTGQVHLDAPVGYGKITADNSGDACGNAPGVRYNDDTGTWQFSNDGSSWVNLGTGSGPSSGSFNSIKVWEYVSSPIAANTSHTIPNGETYTLEDGKWLDVYFNGQLLTHKTSTQDFDYEEVSLASIKFHFDIPANAVLGYIIRKQ